MQNVNAAGLACKPEVHSGPDWLWASYGNNDLAMVLATIDAAPKAPNGKAVGSRAWWIERTGLTPRKFDRALHKAKLLPFVVHGTWKRAPQKVGTCEGQRAVWLAIDPSKIQGMPETAPWKKPKRPKRQKPDRKAYKTLDAKVVELKQDWDGDPSLVEPKFHKPAPPWAAKTKARAIAYAQRDGNVICSAGWIVDLLGMVSKHTLRKSVPVDDLWVLEWGIYSGRDGDYIGNELPDWDKSKPVPMTEDEQKGHVRSLTRLLADQMRVVLQAGFRRPKAAKSGSGKHGKISK